MKDQNKPNDAEEQIETIDELLGLEGDYVDEGTESSEGKSKGEEPREDEAGNDEKAEGSGSDSNDDDKAGDDLGDEGKGTADTDDGDKGNEDDSASNEQDSSGTTTDGTTTDGTTTDGTTTDGTTTDGTAASSDGTDSKELDVTSLLKEIDRLSAEKLAGKYSSSLKPEDVPAVKEEPSPKPETPPGPDVPKDTPPLQTMPSGKLFADQRSFEEALDSHEAMNLSMQQFQSSMFELIAVKLIPVVGQMIKDYISNHDKVKSFYDQEENRPLNAFRNVMELEMTELRAKDSKLGTEELLTEAAKNVNGRIGQFIKTKTNGSARPNSTKPKPRFANPGTGGKRKAPTPKVDPSSQQALIDAMDF